MASLSSHGSSHLVTVHLKGYLRLWRVSTDGGVDIEPKDSALVPRECDDGGRDDDVADVMNVMVMVKR